MSSNRLRRINKELADIAKDPHASITITAPNPADLSSLIGTFTGPADTPYEGGRYEIAIQVPPDYPFHPPKMKFTTRIWHPNVSSQTGAICMDTLSTAWSPVLTIKSALLSLQSLLCTPEPKDPQDAEVAAMMMRDLDTFQRVAHEWAVRFAGAPQKEIKGSSQKAAVEAAKPEKKDDQAAYRGYHPNLVQRFTDMGFEVEQVVSAFEYVGIDRMGGQDYHMEEAYMGDVTARLFGEP